MIVASLIPLAATVEKLQTKHSWLPEWYEIAFGGFAFLVVAALLGKFAIPQLTKGLKARRERIGNEIDGSRAERRQATADAAAIRAELGDIDSEKARILAVAESDTSTILRDGRRRIEVEISETEARGLADIAASGGRVSSEMQAEISGLAAAATEQVVMGSLDDATHQSLIEEFIAKVGAQ